MITALVATAADEQSLSIYAPQAYFTVSLLDRGGRQYVPLLEVLAPLGATDVRQDGDKWKLRFNNTDSEFKARKTKAKVNRWTIELAGPFLLDNGRGLVPLHSLGTILTRLLSQVEVREAARRVFIGGAATQFREEFQPAGPKLMLHFSAPVNPTIATEPGRMRMVFARDPLIGAEATRSLDDKIIRAIGFSEHDGVAEITISSSAPLMASFGDHDRTITVSPAPQAHAQGPPSLPPAPPSAPSAPAGQTAQAPTPASPATGAPLVRPRATVVIDPGHGGDDRGAALSETLAEKDVTLAWARRLRSALEQHGVPAALLRDSDVALSFDDRAALANAARPLVFISLHAGNTGSGVRIYTAHLADAGVRPAVFLPWNSAQAAYLDSSRAVAGSIAEEMSKRSVPAGTAPVLMRPLNNVTAAAVAIEVMPPTADVMGLMSAGYQQAVCTAIADGVAAAIKPAPHPNPAGGPQ